MERKLYLATSVFLLFQGILFGSAAQAWVSAGAFVGKYETVRYQSSNPTVELKETRALNQAYSEECYMYAFIGALEVANKNAWNRLGAPEISSEHMFIKKFEAWADETLRNQTGLDNGFYFQIGGDVHNAMKLSVDWGLYPNELFKPRKAFTDWDFEALYKDVRTIVREEKIKVARAQNEAQFAALYKSAMSRLQKRTSQDAGTFLDNFQWKGRDWDVHSFENSFGIKRNSSIYMMYPTGRWDMGDPWDLRHALYELIQTFNGSFRYKQSSWASIWRYLVDSIDQGLPAMLSMRWASSYHVLDVVGYEYDNQNKLVSFKLKNSWGKDYGRDGHAYFLPEDLKKYVSTVWGFKTPNQ